MSAVASDDSRLKPSRFAELWPKAAQFGAAYILCAVAGDHLSVRGSPFVTFWLPAGLYLAVLLLNPTRDWPWLALAILPANLIFDLFYGTKFLMILAFYCANTLQAVTGAWLVRRCVAKRPTLATLKEFFGLLGFAAVFSAMLGSCVTAEALIHFGLSHSFGQSFRNLWGSNAMAILVLTPFILAWSSKSNGARGRFGPPKKIAEAAALLLAVVIYVWLLLYWGHGIMSMNRTWAIPLLLWAGLRFGARGATAITLLLSLSVAFFTTQYAIGLDGTQISTGQYVFPMQAVLAMVSLVALIPAIVVAERNRTLAELRESEERFKKLSAAAFEGIFISENGRILDANDQGLKMFGYERGEMIGRQITEFVAPEWRDIIAERLRAGVETIYGHQLIRKDGGTFLAEAQAKTVVVGKRKLRMTALRDVTERKHSEEALRKSEALFRNYFELAMVGCAITSIEKGMLAVNDQFCQMLGYSREELVKMTWAQLTHPDDVAADVAEFNRLLAGEIDSYTLDKRFLRKDGREIFATIAVRCVRHPDGSPDYVIGLAMDISGRKRAEAALRESEEKFSKAFQASPNGICITELETGRFVEVNEGYCRLFHYTREALIGHTAVELGIFENMEERRHFLDTLLAQGSVRDMELTTYRRDGQKRLVLASAERLELNTRPCIVSVVDDITDRKRVEAERSESIAREQQARTEYTFQLIAAQEAERTRIARELHDSLGQNLLLIKNRAQLEMAGKSLSKHLLEELQSISDIASQTIAEIRQISHDLRPPQLDILGLTRVLQSLVESAGESSPIAITGKIDPVDDVFLREAATNVYRIVQESLNNILKHSNAKKARITLERDVHEAQLRIEDDGCGFRGGGDGKGLGLKNIAERVRMLDGKMKLDSQPEKGVRIEITIPISAEQG